MKNHSNLGYGGSTVADTDGEGSRIMCRAFEEAGAKPPRGRSDAELERQFQAEHERLQLEDQRIRRECERLEEVFYRPRGILGWFGYRTSVPGF